jgi:predicted  nucleic acid-binding Zn-ribbon protein
MEQRVIKLENDMADVKTRLAVAESNIKDIKEDISSIKDDTKWLRRTITNAIVVGVIGGVIALYFAAIKGGM